MRTILLAGLLCIPGLCIGLPHTALAAVWVEVGDAGKLPGTAQITTGAGPLTSISGTLSDDVDVDLFKIFITGGGTFSASTVGLTAVDTKLFLFDAAGLGVYVNDDADVFTLQSELPAGDPLTPVVPGVYYLAIAGFDLDPVSIAGDIFPDPLFPEGVFGATGPGAGSPLTDFEGLGDFGPYSITLTGAVPAVSGPATVPEPSSIVVWSIGAAIAIRWRRTRKRHKVAQVGSLRID